MRMNVAINDADAGFANGRRLKNRLLWRHADCAGDPADGKYGLVLREQRAISRFRGLRIRVHARGKVVPGVASHGAVGHYANPRNNNRPVETVLDVRFPELTQTWRKYSVSFTPTQTGDVRLVLVSSGYGRFNLASCSYPGRTRFISEIRADGAELRDGDFSKSASAGAPWLFGKGARLLADQSGGRFAALNSGGTIQQYGIKVTKDQPVTLSFRARKCYLEELKEYGAAGAGDQRRD